MTRTYPLVALNIESFPALTECPVPHANLSYHPFESQSASKQNCLSMPTCSYMYLKDVCEVLVHEFNMKQLVGDTEHWADTG